MTNILRNMPLLTVALLAVVAVALSGCGDDDQAGRSSSPDAPSSADVADTSVPPDGEVVFSGPYTHDNLTIFLIHGVDTIEGDKFLTLEQALDDGTLVPPEVEEGDKVIECCVSTSLSEATVAPSPWRSSASRLAGGALVRENR